MNTGNVYKNSFHLKITWSFNDSKLSMLYFAGNLSNLSIQNRHLIKFHRILNLEKLNNRKLYKIQLALNTKRLRIKLFMRKSLTVTISTGK